MKRLLLLCLSCLPTLVYAQTDSVTSLSIGTIQTQAERAATTFLIDYFEELSPTQLNFEDVGDNSASMVYFSPEASLQTGENDSFNSVLFKLGGTYLRAGVTEIANLKTPETDTLMHAVPFSFGIEADRDFNNVVGLLEVGYVPFHLGSSMKWGLENKVGVFAQLGYKTSDDDNDLEAPVGGAVDQSEEADDEAVARLKFNTQFRFMLHQSEGFNVAIVPDVNAWFDMRNSEVYHQAVVKLVFGLTEDMSFDLRYEDGSGAPNFNEGDQFGAHFTIAF